MHENVYIFIAPKCVAIRCRKLPQFEQFPLKFQCQVRYELITIFKSCTTKVPLVLPLSSAI